MPVYEYQCKACGHEFEREQRISDAPVKKCPSCGKSKLRRMISSGNFILKGGGWYVTDYPSESRKKAMKAETSSSTAPESSTASESTPSTSGTSGGTSSSIGSGGTSNGGGTSSSAKSEGGKSDSGKSDSGKSDGRKSKPAPSKKPSD